MSITSRGHTTRHAQTDVADQPRGKREAEVLYAIETYIARHDRPPTVREIAEDTGIRSLGHVAYLLKMLERHGHIIREHGVSRGIQLRRPVRRPTQEVLGVPILGTIAAGVPLDLFEQAEPPEVLDLAAHAHVHDSADGGAYGHKSVHTEHGEFALRVRGNSMIEDGILDGDYVLVRPGNAASEGAVVVAVHLLGDGAGERGAATLKRLHFQTDERHGRRCIRQVLLCPANAALRPIKVSVEDWEREWQVQGTVTAIYRPCGFAARRW